MAYNSFPRRDLLIFCLLPLCLLTACSWFSTRGKQDSASIKLPDPAPKTVKVEPLKTPGENAIEIIWELPQNPVDGYVLKYGFSADKLTTQLTLSLNDIERYEDPRFGFVYRYYLPSIPANKRVFLTLATIRGNQISAPSDLMEIAPAIPPARRTRT